ncbi:hypothetical protein BGY98DRAFT_98799 [Russula aff. rugulosa BPL654]|nr:hypothetical protein BGY98DRAFT_98799 [Russula aff. rugulosa BPL654]
MPRALPSPTESEFSQLSDYAPRFLQQPSLCCLQARDDVLLFGHLSDSPEARLPYGELKDTLGQAYGTRVHHKLKQACWVFGHMLNAVWKAMGPLVPDLLNAQRVAWMSIDVARFITNEAEPRRSAVPSCSGSVFVPIRSRAMTPSTLPTRSFTFSELQHRRGRGRIPRIRLQAVGRSSASLLRFHLNTTVDVRGPLLPLSDSPSLPLTGRRPGHHGPLLRQGWQQRQGLGLTCHHVLFKMDGATNNDYVFAGACAPRQYVQLLGTRASDKLLASIKIRIGRHGIMVDNLRGADQEVGGEGGW